MEKVMVVIAALVWLGSWAWSAELTVEEKARVKGDLEGEIPGMIYRYQLSDALYREGIGKSDATTSGGLGWGENGYLRRYMMCYLVTQDTYWLDKVIDHFDRMIANLSDHDDDGLLSWQDPVYSVALVEAVVLERTAVGIEVKTPNGDRRVYYRKGGKDITGHDYLLEFTAPDEFKVTDLTDDVEMGVVKYEDPTTFDLVPGTKLVVSGAGVQGAMILVRTTAPEACEYQVHDGMVTYPVAQFIEQVRMRDDLDEKYQQKADEYLKLLHEHFIMRWEKTWMQVAPDAGVYVFTDNPTQRFPFYSLPHNQYLAPARTCLVLADVEGYEGAELCAKRARNMANYFKQNLKLTEEEAYVWNYWDPLPHEDVGRHIEDISHGTIDIGFAIEARHRGVVFTEEDLERLARTFVDVMWNGDEENPRFGARVDTSEGDKGAWWEWIQLAEADHRVWELAMAIFERGSRAASMCPSMAWLYDKLVGLSEEERAQCRQNTAQALEIVNSEGLVNGGFEIASPGGNSAAGWTLGRWGPDSGESEMAWVADAYEGERAVALMAKGEKVNVWAQCDKTIEVAPPASVTIKAYYKAEEGSRPYFSILGYDEKGEQVQYDSSAGFEATDEWREATWTKEMRAEVRAVKVMLRNGAPGKVVWDQVEVEIAK